jgi:replicative DNA helicase
MTTGYIENLDEIKAKLNPEAVLELLQPGKKRHSGKELRSPCPVHGGDGAENFSLNVDTHNWICHSNGCKGVNLVDLYAQSKKMQVNAAAAELAMQFGIPVKYKETMASNRNTSYSPESVLTCWDEAQPQGKDTYFSKKRLQPPPIARFGSNPKGYQSTLIPYKDINGELKCLLSLSSSGKFNFSNPNGAFALLGEINPEGEFYIGEGIATVQTAWEATQREIPAFSCGTWRNILTVVTAIKGKYPNSKPIILIDCDNGGNGLKAAQMVSNAFPDTICRKPYFKTFSNSVNEKLTDFNDIISKCSQSLDEVKRQLEINFKLPMSTDDPKTESIENSQQKTAIDTNFSIQAYTLEDLQRDLQQAKEGLKTGYKDLDDIVRIPNAAITLVGGRPSHGKTTFMLNLLLNLINQYPDLHFYFFSYEETRQQIAIKLINILSAPWLFEEAKNLLQLEGYLKLGTTSFPLVENGKKQYQELMESGRLRIIDDTFYIQNFPKIIESLKGKVPLGCVFIDYIQKIKNKQRFGTRQLELANTSNIILETAKRYSIPIILGTQLGRDKENKNKVKLDNLREAGDLEQDANLVLGLHNQAMEEAQDKQTQLTNRKVDLTITPLKNRNGIVNKTVTLEFDRPLLQIKDKK